MSRRSAGAAEPFTVDHFRAYARILVLDNGDRWEPEGFQLEIVEDLFSEFLAVWTIIPEANGKTTLMGGVGLYVADFKPAASILLAAAARDQAELMYEQAAGFVRRTPGMDGKRFRCYDGYRRIKSLRLGGKIQVKAADDATGDGVLYDLALVDELHRQRNLKLYRTWFGKAQKRGGTIGVISTAGEPGSEFEDARAAIKAGASEVREDGFHTRAVNGATVIHDFAVPVGADVDDMEVVKGANPFSGITAASLRVKREDPAMTIDHWRRFVCNQATLTGGSAIGSEEWDRLREDDLTVPEVAWRCGWLDLGWKIDTTALGVLVWESDERRIVTGVRVLEPPVDESQVVAAILHTQIELGADVWVLDPSAGAEQMVQLLEKGTHPLQTDNRAREKHGLPQLAGDERPLEFVAHSQDNAPMAQAASRLDEALRNGWVVHDGDRRLRAHALNAVAKPLGDAKWKFDRPADAKGDRRRKYPIDALTGVLMGHNIAVDEAPFFSAEQESMAAWL